MTALVTGGAASGKSALGEALCLRLRPPGAPLLYIATMARDPGDPECLARIARHRDARAGHGFTTVERPLDLAGLAVPDGAAALLEDLPNLLAGELYLSGKPAERAVETVVRGVRRLAARCRHLVVVTGEVFSDGAAYGPDTRRYIEALGAINRLCAALADAAAESVCGIPVALKGDAPW